MLAELMNCKRMLPTFIDSSLTKWSTLEVLYEPPRVERVWTQVGDNRLFLHRIHPCDQGYYHPHPWPSAVTLLSGEQIMTVGSGPPDGRPPQITTTIHLAAGSSYEMLDPHGWHAVMPQGKPSLSLMLTGQPWRAETAPHPQKSANRPLTDAAKAELLREIRALCLS